MNVGLTELCRAEYETDPNITIDELCDKYNIERSALGPTNDWQKVIDIPTTPLVPAEIIPSNTITPLDTKATPTNKDIIDEFKNLTITEALQRMRNEASGMSVKDMKELVALVDTIDRSYHKSTDSNQINIVVQNVISRYVDDC